MPFPSKDSISYLTTLNPKEQFLKMTFIILYHNRRFLSCCVPAGSPWSLLLSAYDSCRKDHLSDWRSGTFCDLYVTQQGVSDCLCGVAKPVFCVCITQWFVCVHVSQVSLCSCSWQKVKQKACHDRAAKCILWRALVMQRYHKTNRRTAVSLSPKPRWICSPLLHLVHTASHSL